MFVVFDTRRTVSMPTRCRSENDGVSKCRLPVRRREPHQFTGHIAVLRCARPYHYISLTSEGKKEKINPYEHTHAHRARTQHRRSSAFYPVAIAHRTQDFFNTEIFPLSLVRSPSVRPSPSPSRSSRGPFRVYVCIVITTRAGRR